MKDQTWISPYYSGKRGLSTAEVAVANLTSDRDGQIECIEGTLESSIRAIGRFVSVMHKKGLINSAEVQFILDAHGYVPLEEGEQ